MSTPSKNNPLRILPPCPPCTVSAWASPPTPRAEERVREVAIFRESIRPAVLIVAQHRTLKHRPSSVRVASGASGTCSGCRTRSAPRRICRPPFGLRKHLTGPLPGWWAVNEGPGGRLGGGIRTTWTRGLGSIRDLHDTPSRVDARSRAALQCCRSRGPDINMY
jgi:hypothetical protein